MRRFPLFADLDDQTLNSLRRALVTRYADPGEKIVRKSGEPARVFFIASGAVELEAAGQTHRLGRGEMFGQMSILMKRPLRTEVRAIAPSSLLLLDERRFLRLLKRSSTVQEALRDSAAKRGFGREVFEGAMQ